MRSTIIIINKYHGIILLVDLLSTIRLHIPPAYLRLLLFRKEIKVVFNEA